MTVEQIKLDREDYVKQIRELAQENNVFVMYNDWYGRVSKDISDLGNYNSYWRISPFKEYYERTRDKLYFEEKIYFKTIHNGYTLIRIT